MSDAVIQIDRVKEILTTLLSGGICLLPTDTLYGLHASIHCREAVDRICTLKAGGENRKFIVLCQLSQAEELGITLTEHQLRFLRSVWPSPLTAIVRASGSTLFPGGTAAIRHPDHPLWNALFQQGCPPVVSTSANFPGEPPCSDLSGLPDALRKEVDLIVDSGPVTDLRPSTLVDLMEVPPRILRRGKIEFPQNVWKSLWKSDSGIV